MQQGDIVQSARFTTVGRSVVVQKKKQKDIVQSLSAWIGLLAYAKHALHDHALSMCVQKEH